MNWSDILAGLIAAIFSSGAFLSLMYYKENKKAKQIENEKSIVDEWQGIASERKSRCDELKTSLDHKDHKIDELYKENAELRKRNDRLSSANTALSILKCKDISCSKREPPFDNEYTASGNNNNNTKQ